METLTRTLLSKQTSGPFRYLGCFTMSQGSGPSAREACQGTGWMELLPHMVKRGNEIHGFPKSITTNLCQCSQPTEPIQVFGMVLSIVISSDAPTKVLVLQYFSSIG